MKGFSDHLRTGVLHPLPNDCFVLHACDSDGLRLLLLMTVSLHPPLLVRGAACYHGKEQCAIATRATRATAIAKHAISSSVLVPACNVCSRMIAMGTSCGASFCDARDPYSCRPRGRPSQPE